MARAPFSITAEAGFLSGGSREGFFLGESASQPVEADFAPGSFGTLTATETAVNIVGTTGFFEAEVARLDLIGGYLANPPTPATPSSPAVAKADIPATNVFQSISLIDQYVLQAAQGIRGLRAAFGDPASGPADTEESLTQALEGYLDDYMTGDAVNELFPGRADELTIYFPQDSDPGSSDGDAQRPVFTRFQFNNARLAAIEAAITPSPTTGVGTVALQVLHTNLFDAGRVVMEDSRAVQRLRHGLARLRRRRERDLARRREQLAEVKTEIAAARRALASLNGIRQEAAGDAQAAQGLLAENWRATEAAFETRRIALEDNEGLAYVRVREAPVAAALADPLPLRPDTGGRFPWAGRIEGDLPEVLEPFMEAVHEIPVSDWADLAPLIDRLPAPGRLSVLARRRAARLESLIAAPIPPQPTVLFQRLAPVHSLVQAVIADFARLKITPAPSLREQQRQAANALSLNDLAAGGPYRLRREAAGLRDALEQAALGMLGLLSRLPAGVRLAWGSAAEADTLAVRDPARWPALETVREAEFNTLRSLFEVVEWWFARIGPRARPASQTAMTAMMRGLLMLAADDDPAEILRGSVRVAIPRLIPGAALRLRLNRRARPGAILHLMDPSNAVVGLVRVDDEDADGVSATVTQSLASAVAVDTRFTVIEQRLAVWE